ncbi:carbon-nitrogen hydrolase family protein [Rhodococcus sp. NM-2]|jgi:predicted amidohydrolase|uniref:carbon-nitrogen hydrolase family protein n=1 Tax=Rhodococcus TaxID=1827 RepID=UPI0024730386|nr:MULTISPECIES: carbon-nitrogen hydrolase family protein [Rhodococcus]MDH6286656.1 putative amidohydrolase [Rhodococcus opacus]MDI9950635.1 carbon-nitrogen hydrolase family protein [Rhodococcus sp. IEGM 1305]MDI9972707.1 carbon-nitrogen hydrolase family protein [Rhodococcus sp. IEGM 1307]
MVDIAIAQFAPGSDKQDNLGRIAKFAEEAAAGGARVLAAPEYAMFTVPTMDERFVDSAESLDGEFVTGLGEIAARHRLILVAGINEAIPGERRIFNTLVAVAPDGSIAAAYRKLHLYDAFGYKESDFVQAGSIGEPETFTVDGVTFGMQTCYDLRFPEVTRRIVDSGADVLVLPAEWVPGPLKEDHWTTLVRARAIENTIYVAAADQSAPAGSGASMIVDPMGVVIASLGERVGTAIGTVSPERIAEVRAKNPALSLRRFGVVANQ